MAFQQLVNLAYEYLPVTVFPYMVYENIMPKMTLSKVTLKSRSDLYLRCNWSQDKTCYTVREGIAVLWFGPLHIGCHFQLDFFMYLWISFLHNIFVNWSYVDCCIVLNLLLKRGCFPLSTLLESCLVFHVFFRLTIKNWDCFLKLTHPATTMQLP